MKKRRYTIQIIPDNEEPPRILTFSTTRVRILLILLIMFIVILSGTLYWMVPKVMEYGKLKTENEYLISESLKAARIIKDYNRIKQMDTFIKEKLGVELGLPQGSGNADSSGNNENRENNIPISSLENIPTYPPVSGFITQHFHVDPLGRNPAHYGIDIASRSGEPIYAAAGGVVVFSGWTYRYGYTVIISHGDDFFTLYAHNLRNTVEIHQRVKRGDLIGYLGNSGLSYGPHLHFEVWKNGKPIDPVQYVKGYEFRDVSIDAEISPDSEQERD